MKRIVTLLILSLCLCACGSHSATTANESEKGHIMTWQEQYDLGVRYLSEGNYEEAIIAFTAAIEIDPKQPTPYVGRGDAYNGAAQLSMTNVGEDTELTEDAAKAYSNAVADYLKAIDLDESVAELYKKAAEVYVTLGDTEAAVEILERGIAATGNGSLSEYLEQLNNEIANERAQTLLQPLYELFEAGDIESAKGLMRQAEYCDMSAELSEGYFCYDAGNGNVLAIYPDNFYYFGQWQNGQRSGHGIWIQAVFDEDIGTESYIYEGSWENDLPNGKGIITQHSTNYDGLGYDRVNEFSGSFSDGFYDGTFLHVLRYADGNILSGALSAINGVLQPVEGSTVYEGGYYYVAIDEIQGAYMMSCGEIHKVWGFY